MADSGFQFKVGHFECMVVNDGTIIVPPHPPENIEGLFIPPQQSIAVLCLFINTGEHKILVDTGCGSGFQATAGKLLQNLENEGILPADIDMIIYTHGHGDHVLGSYDVHGKPVFPNAKSILAKKEWEFLEVGLDASQKLPMFAAARKNFLPAENSFEKVEDGDEVLSGIRLRVAPGHTPGNTFLELSSGTEQLLCTGDLIHSPVEFSQPDYYALFDVSPDQAVRSKNQILSGAAKSGVLVFACHFKYPGLGHIVKKGDILTWQPLEMIS